LKETKEVQPVDKIENWLIKIFPKSKENVLKSSELNDQDNITDEAIDSRIIILGLTIAIIISLVIFGQIIQISKINKKQKIVVEHQSPDIINAFCKYFK
jgi:hypothetical protein